MPDSSTNVASRRPARRRNLGGRPKQWTRPMKAHAYYVSVDFGRAIATAAKREKISTGEALMRACTGTLRIDPRCVATKAVAVPA